MRYVIYANSLSYEGGGELSDSLSCSGSKIAMWYGGGGAVAASFMVGSTNATCGRIIILQ